MRILQFICGPGAGGAEIYVRDLSITMREAGHDVHIVFLQSAAESNRDIEFEKLFLESLSKESISYSFIGKDSRKKPWLGISRLREVVKSFKPDIIHCHLYYALFFSFFISSTPIVYTHHNIKLGIPKFVYRLFDLRVSAYIGISNACKKILMHGKNRNVVQITNAVSRNRIPLRDISELEAKPEVDFIFVGMLSPQKNLGLMLQAFSGLKNQNARLKIVGEGPDRDKLEALAKTLDLEDQVSFLGNIYNVGALLAQSDVFVMSSAWEGLPIALIEATLIGLPVIVTNVGGCSEVVHQCANGFVVDSLDVDDYQKALQKMMDNKDLRLLFSKNALKFSKSFEINEAAEKHLQLYQKIISD